MSVTRFAAVVHSLNMRCRSCAVSELDPSWALRLSIAVDEFSKRNTRCLSAGRSSILSGERLRLAAREPEFTLGAGRLVFAAAWSNAI